MIKTKIHWRAVLGAAVVWSMLSALPRYAVAIDAQRYLAPPEVTNRQSGYTALTAGLDGKIYVGSAYYGGSGWLVEFDPETEQWTKLINAHQATRETGTGLDSQTKFHAKLQVDADGTIWAATKQGNESFDLRPEYGENPTGYPGGHLFSYNPHTGQVIHHGILKKQEGLMGGAIDRKRRMLYYWSDPKMHFLIYDIVANTVTDKGSIGGSPRYMVIDPQGRVFGTGRPGVLWMYDPSTDTLSDLAVQLQGPGTYQAPYVVVISADGKAIYGCAIGGKYVTEFDLTSIKLEAGDRQTVPGTNGTIVCRNAAEVPLPGDQHAGTLGQDGCFYIANGQRVVRYDPKTKQAHDLGRITLNGKPLEGNTSPQGACVAPDGTLYFKYIYPYSLLKFDRLTMPKGGK